jgi:hypothetical protein
MVEPSRLLDLSLTAVLELAEPYEHQKRSAVYFLISHDEVVYVGQSGDVECRLLMPRERKIDFDRVYILDCPADARLAVERHYILKFQPRHNRQQFRTPRARGDCADCAARKWSHYIDQIRSG